MKRQYLSILLLVALVLASVSFLTSCKDYANDISNLQDQIDKAALTTDVQTLKSQVEANAQKELATADTAKKAFDQAVANAAAISGHTTNINAINQSLEATNNTIKSNAEKAAARIDSLARAGAVTDTKITDLQIATKDAADSAALALSKNRELFGELTDVSKELSGEIKTIQNTLTQWAEAKSLYYTANEIDNKLDILAGDIEYALVDLSDLRKTVEGYQVTVNALYTAVTGVYLLEAGDFKKELNFKVGTITTSDQKDFTFGKEELDDKNYPHSAAPTYTYVNGDQLTFPEEILIRVNPVNAKVDKDMIRFFDSKGGNLDNFLEVVSVTKYDEYLTRASETGLWRVKLQLKKPYDKETVPQKDNSKTENNSILFAVGVNNTLSQTSIDAAADRYVLSDYDLTVDTIGYTKATSLDSVKVNGTAIKANGKEPTIDKDGTPLVEAKNGIFEISFEDESLKDQVDCFYVICDDQHASETDQWKEASVWQKYEYTGLNKVVKVENGVGKDTVSVKLDSGTYDEVQFRIFAVNYDGTLVETNGRAFRVSMGSIKASVKGDINFVSYQKMETDWLPVSGTLTDGQYGSVDLVSKSTVTVMDDNKNEVTLKVEYAKDNTGTRPTKDSEIKYVKFSLDESSKNEPTIKNWLNEGKAVGVLADESHPANNAIQVTLTKKMPTSESARKVLGYEGMSSDGVYTAYMYPYIRAINATTPYFGPFWGEFAKTVYHHMATNNSKFDNNYTITVDNMVKKSQTSEYTESLDVKRTINNQNWLLYTDGISLVDNKTQHKTVVKYNFGNISSEANGSYEILLETFQTILASPLDDSVQKFECVTSEGNSILYGENASNSQVLKNVKATNSSGLSGFDKTLNALIKGNDQKYINTASYITAKLISNNTKQEDYFTVTIYVGYDENKITCYFTAKKKSNDTESNPAADVPSTLVVTLTDAFKHTHTINIPFTVKRRE